MSEHEHFQKKYLIVDDSSVNAQFLRFYFDQIGISSVLAANAVEAYDHLKANQFTLSFVDQHIPEITGTDFLLKCFEEDVLNKLGEAYIFTAQDDFDADLYGVNHIISGVIYKPVDISDIEKIIV